MADNDIVRRGYLNVVQKPKGGVIGRVLSVTSRRYWVVLRRESGNSSCRIELYRSEDQSGEPVRVINLSTSHLRNIDTLERKKAFVLLILDDSVMFQCSSRAEMEDWYRDLQHYTGSRRSSGGGGSRSSSSHNTTGAGEIYEIIPDDETYRVRLRKAKTLSFYGPCLLEILRDFERNLFHIGLFTEGDVPQLIVKWQIDHVRQYGSNSMTFKFESGTKSPTGVDWFILDTEPGFAVKIHRVVDYWAKHIVEQVKNMPASSSGRSVPRRSTLPSNSTPDNSRPTGHQRNSTSAVSSAPNNGMYMPLQQGSMSQASVYATPDSTPPAKPPNPVSRNKRPAPPPGTSAGPNSTYMALDVNSMNPSGNQTYEGIAPRNPLPPRPNGASNQQLYMGIDPRTKNATDGGQYMGLNEARSN